MIKTAFFIILSSFLFFGCEKFVEVGIPPNQLSSKTTFDDESGANSAVSAIYAALSTGSLSANMQLAMEYYGGDLVYNGTADNYVQFLNGSIQTDNSLISSFWNELYQNIYNCNTTIESLERSHLTSDTKNRFRAECLFLRAFNYSFLVKCWGDVPLILDTDWQTNQSLGRSPEATVYEQMASDLEEAKALFDTNAVSDNTRANYYTATALLSRIYFRMENWEKAIENVNLTLSNTSYSMETVSNVFLNNSKETIFQLTSISPSYQNTNLGQQMVPSVTTSIPTVGISASLVADLSDNDQRWQWIGTNEVQELPYYYPYKYKEGYFSTEKKENLIVLRLAEQYLIRAMAHLKLDQSVDALNDLNVVRSRSADVYETLSEAAILKEMKLEFFAEWGIGNLHSINYWPIPLAQLEANPFLTPTPGY